LTNIPLPNESKGIKNFLTFRLETLPIHYTFAPSDRWSNSLNRFIKKRWENRLWDALATSKKIKGAKACREEGLRGTINRLSNEKLNSTTV